MIARETLSKQDGIAMLILVKEAKAWLEIDKINISSFDRSKIYKANMERTTREMFTTVVGNFSFLSETDQI